MFTGAAAVVLCLVRDKVHVYWGWCCVLSEIRSMFTGAGAVSSQR